MSLVFFKMASLIREASVQLRLDVSEGSSSVFDILKDKGVNPEHDLLAVQELPSRLWDVTFKSMELRRKFWPALSVGKGYAVTTYAHSTTLVTVLHVPYELNDNVVRHVLSRYGRVVCGRFLTCSDYPNVFNGIRQYKVDLRSDIPSSLLLGGRNCWVRYRGQPRTCLKCGDSGHEAKECDQRKCYNCQGAGHTSKECEIPAKCSVCEKSGHNYRDCPVSFANKIKPVPLSWIVGGAAVQDGETKEKEDETGMKTESPPLNSVSGGMAKPPSINVEGEQGASTSMTVHDSMDKAQPTSKTSRDVDPPVSPQDLSDEVTTVRDSQDVNEMSGEDSQMESADSFSISEIQSQSDLFDSQPQTPNPFSASASGKESIVDADDRELSSKVKCSSLPAKNDGTGSLAMFEVQNESQDNLFSSPGVSKRHPSTFPAPVSPSQDGSSTKDRESRARRKSSSLPTKKDRSRSSIRYPPEEPMDRIKMTQIFIEEEPWHSCYSKGCDRSFSSFQALKEHVAELHPKMKYSPYPCVLKKTCNRTFTAPREWIFHIASDHPEFVQKQDLEFFDRFFLKP